MKQRYLCFSALILTMAFAGCYNDKYTLLYPDTGTCSTDSVTYSGTVKDIMVRSCALSNCHNSASAMSGVVLDNLAGVQATAKSGMLVGVINHASGFSPMPKNGTKLDDCTIRKISKWVADGAPAN